VKRDNLYIVTTAEAGFLTISIMGAFFVCTGCSELKKGSEFGLRKMKNNLIRNQPRCKKCRGKYGKK
jgi:hypothetical protein